MYFATLRYALVVALELKSRAFLGAAAAITMNSTLYDGTQFIGSSSSESAAASRIAGYPCCMFVGNFQALSFDPRTRKFRLRWNIEMIPSSLRGFGNGPGLLYGVLSPQLTRSGDGCIWRAAICTLSPCHILLAGTRAKEQT